MEGEGNKMLGTHYPDFFNLYLAGIIHVKHFLSVIKIMIAVDYSLNLGSAGIGACLSIPGCPLCNLRAFREKFNPPEIVKLSFGSFQNNCKELLKSHSRSPHYAALS